MPVTSNDIANEALQDIGWNQVSVAGVAPTFDGTTAGLILQRIYQPCVAAVLRSYPFECGRQIGLALTLSGNVAPAPFAYEYLFPSNCVEFLQLMPPTFTDPNDPLPQLWDVGNAQVAAVMTKVIWTNVQNARGAYTITPIENIWDAGLRQAVVMRLGRGLALALSKPETAAGLSEQALQELAMAQSRTDT